MSGTLFSRRSNSNQAGSLGDLSGQFVQQIVAQTGDPGVQPAQFAFGLVPILATLGPSSQFLVQAAQLF